MGGERGAGTPDGNAEQAGYAEQAGQAEGAAPEGQLSEDVDAAEPRAAAGRSAGGGFGRVEADGDRAVVRFERRYAAPPAQLWDALTSPERLARWFGATAEVRPGVGGSVDLRWDGGEQWVRGDILAWDPPRALSYTWTFPGEDESYVRFDLEPDGDGTLLHLTHRRLGPAGSGYGAAWHAYLDRLAALLAGTDLDWLTRFTELRPHYAGRPYAGR